MSYAIIGGIGLLLGLGLMIWALRERSLRSDLEKDLNFAKNEQERHRKLACLNADIAAQQTKDLKRLSTQVTYLRSRLGNLRERLVKCRDPETIKEWLDEELKEEEI
jgi:hypothetical protein